MICQCLANQLFQLLTTEKTRYFAQSRPIIVNCPSLIDLRQIKHLFISPVRKILEYPKLKPNNLTKISRYLLLIILLSFS